MNQRIPLIIIAIIGLIGLFLILKVAPKSQLRQSSNNTVKELPFTPEIVKSEAEWKKQLTAEQYHVLRERRTDIPFTHAEMLNEKRAGTYVTIDCNEPVFRSEQKFDSGTGWPSFMAPIDGSVVELTDQTLGMVRTEIVGKKCGGHLGHVFNDGPAPSGKRYCINATALKFIPDEG